MSTKSKSGGKPAKPAAKSSKSNKVTGKLAEAFSSAFQPPAPSAEAQKKVAPAATLEKPAAKKASKKLSKPTAPREQARADSTTMDGRLHESQIESPVKAMWDLCDSMKGSRRKDVLAKAAEIGIAFYTARTQYQLWSRAVRDSEATVRAAASSKGGKK